MKKYEDAIETARKKITELAAQQDDVYRELVSKIKPTEQQEEWLYDYCFNYSFDTEYAQFIKQNIYGE
jgi:hypothetical protein